MSDRTTPNGRIIIAHAQQSLLRHGFQEPFDLVDDIIENYSRRTTQDDGATVYIAVLSWMQYKIYRRL